MIKFERKWLVLFVACYGCSTSIGLVTNMAVLYYEWLTTFGKSKAETALVQSVCVGVFNITGVFMGILVTKFGQRTVGMVAALVSSIGLVLSFFATSVTYLVLVFGTCTGLGSGGLFISSATSIGQYFEGKQKHMVLSFMSFGGGIGGIVLTYILNSFSLKYGWRGCMLIIGGIVLQNVSIFGLCKPKLKDQVYFKVNASDVYKETNKMNAKNDILRKLKELGHNKLFYLNALGLCCIICALFSSLIIFVDFFKFKGFSRDEAVTLYLVNTITGTATRLLPGLLKQVPRISIFAIALLHAGVGTVALFLFPSVTSFTGSVVLMGCIGFSLAGTLGSVIHITVLKTTGTECFSIGLGVVLTCSGASRMLVGPMTGYLRDVTGSYDVSFYMNGGFGLCGVVCYMVLLYLHTSKTHNSSDRKGQNGGDLTAENTKKDALMPTTDDKNSV